MTIKWILIFTLSLVNVISADEVNESENNNESSHKNFVKRGILNYGGVIPAGYGYGYDAAAFLPKSPLLYKSHGLFDHASPYVLRHGGAAVTSYNVNYPRYPYYGGKYFGYPGLVSNVPAISPVLAPAAAPIIPQAPVFASIAPTTAVFAPPNFSVSSPVFTFPVAPQRPVVAAAPAIPSFSLRPAVPSIPATPAQPAVPSGVGFIPQNIIPLIPNTPLTTTTLPPPTHPPSNLLPGQPWRPIITNSPTTPPTPSFQRPSITLLPPYEPSSHRSSPDNFHIPSREYLVPHLQHQLAEQQFLHEQQQAQIDHQQAQIEQQQQLLDAQGEFLRDEQSSDSEQAQYFGLSSYDVPLPGNKGYSY